MEISSITSFFSNSVSKAQSFILGTDKKSPTSKGAQRASSLDPPHQVSRLRNLENKLSDTFCEASDYVKGFTRGINPTSAIVEPIESSLKIQDGYCSDGKSFNNGQQHGAALGIVADTFVIASGATTGGLSFACEGLSLGACSLAAVPAAALATTQVATGALMAVGHGNNFNEARNNAQKLKQKTHKEISETVVERTKDHKYISAYKGNELPGFPGTKKTLSKTSVQGGGKLRDRWKDNKGQIFEWDFKKGTVEKYSKNGKHHLGEFDPYTGKQVGPAKTERWVEK